MGHQFEDFSMPYRQDARLGHTVDPCFNLDIVKTLKTIASIWVQAAASKGLALKIIVDKALPNIIFQDTLKIQYCLNNLISNAVKFTPHGSIKLRAYKLQSKDGSQYLALSVIDSGPGISDARIESLFLSKLENHKLNEEQRIGTIDTSLCATKNIIEDLGGHLLVKSTVGKGSLFSLVLPLSEAQQSVHPDALAKQTQSFKLSDINLLVVDDYNLNQLTIKTLLQDYVSKIYIAGNGFEALEVLNSCPVHVVLMDIHMPGMDGIEAIIRIRENSEPWSDVFIIALTADHQYQHTSLCKKIGMDGALAKPIRRTDILRVLSSLPYSRLLTLAA